MNKNNSILLIDPSFDPATASHCSLLMKVGLDSFSYAIIDKETNQVSAVFDEQECEDVVKKLGERLKNDSYLTLPYQEIKIALHTDNVIAVPDELFIADNLSVHTQFFTAPHTENLYANPQSHFGFTTIFALSTTADDVLRGLESKKYPGTAGLLSLAKHIAGIALVLDFTVGSVNFLYLKHQKVIFQQCYEIENIEEFNYYLLLLINQLQIELEDTTVHLNGIVHETDEKYDCLSKYFEKIAFIYVDGNLDQRILDDMPSHYYNSLLALDQCE